MPKETTLVRPDGSLVTVDSDKAQHLVALGYKPETDDQAFARNAAAGQEAYYSTGAQQLKTGLEGVASGLSLGVTDIALEAMGADTAERAKHNPGIRMGAEIVGGLLPIAPGGIGRLVAHTPAGLVSKGAAMAAGKFASPMARGVVAGAIEGAAIGGQQEVASSLTGDPLTVEGTLAGMGWGALFGGGLGGFAGAAKGRIEAKAAVEAAKAEAKVAAEAAKKQAAGVLEENWGAVRNTVRETSDQIGATFKAVEEEATKATTTLKSAEEMAKKFGGTSDNLSEISQALNQTKSGYMGKLIKDGYMKLPGVREAHTAAAKSISKLEKAIKAKDFGKIAQLQEEFSGHMTALNEKIPVSAGTPGMGMPELPELVQLSKPNAVVKPSIKLQQEAAVKAYEELGSLATAGDVLKNFPVTPEGLGRVSPARMEKMQAAVDSFMGAKSAEFGGLQRSMEGTVDALSESMGVRIEGGSTGQKLRGVWEAIKNQAKTSVVEGAAEAVARNKTPWWKSAAGQAAGRSGSRAADAAGLGPIGQSAGYSVARDAVMGLLALKAGVVGMVSQAAMKWAPKLVRVGEVLAPRVEPLMTRLDGVQEDKDENRTELMRRRSEEIRGAAGSVRDTLYKSISPMTVEHPEYAKGVFDHSVKQFQFMLNKLPKDPGNAFNRLKTLWKPDPVETEKFARYYEVFQNPVVVMNRALETGHITPQAAEGLREMWPALFTHLRVEMLHKVTQPEIMNKLSYDEQVSLGTLLDLPLHSTMMPKFIASQQQMFTLRNEPMGMPQQPGAQGGNGGRPAGPANSPYSSAGQKVTNH